MQKPIRFHVIVAIAVCIVGTLAAWGFLSSRQYHWKYWLAHWLLIVNLVTFAYYGLDKWLAIRKLWRVPELVLHTLSAIGGSPGAFAAMWAFRHKTIKSSFRILFWSIVILQTTLAVYIVKVALWD